MNYKRIVALLCTAAIILSATGGSVYAENISGNSISDNFVSDEPVFEEPVSKTNERADALDPTEAELTDYERALLMDADPLHGNFADDPLQFDSDSAETIPELDKDKIEATSSDKWDLEESNASPRITIDTSTHYGNSTYSIKMTNTAFGFSTIGKTFTVKPNTTYRFSAMAKCADIVKYTDDEERSGSQIAAAVGKWWSYYISPSYSGENWRKMEYRFTTEADTSSIQLALLNGTWRSYNKGTVWYSDIKLEEFSGTPTNEWNVLNIILKNVDVKGITYNNETIDYHDTFNNTDVAYLKEYNEHSAEKFNEFSGGLMKVKCVDTVSTDDPVTELAHYDWVSDPNVEHSYSIHAYRLDEKSPSLQAILDAYIDGADKTYNLINLYAPLNGVCGDSTGTSGWLGLNGSYRGIYFTQMQYKSGTNSYNSDREAPAMVHETLHQLENQTRQSYPDMFVQLHAREQYASKYPDNKSWYTAYMRAQIDGSKGIHPSFYKVYNDDIRYTVIFESEQSEAETDPTDPVDPVPPENDAVRTTEQLIAALQSIRDPLTDYTIELAADVTLDSLDLPKNAKSITFKGKGGRKIIRLTKPVIKSKYPLCFIDIDIKSPTPTKITCGSALYLENMPQIGSLSANGSLSVCGSKTTIIGSVNAKGKNALLSLENVDLQGKASSAGNATLKNCHLNSSLKVRGAFTAGESVQVDGAISAKRFTTTSL